MLAAPLVTGGTLLVVEHAQARRGAGGRRPG